MRGWRAILLAGLILLPGPAAWAGVTWIEITRREPFAAGESFGTAGPYEKIVGRFHGELDPGHPLNREIVDLDKAPRNARGRVEYSADFLILKPVNLALGNGALLYDVNNRGRPFALRQYNSAPANNDPSTPQDAGNGFLMRHGFTVVWSGWLADLPSTPGLLRLQVPAATDSAGPIVQTVWDELVFDGKPEEQARLSFRAASTDPVQATLLVRESSSTPPRLVPPGQWEFVDTQTIRLLPAGSPFQRATIYQFIYRAVDPPVAGIGFAATRDWVSFLRYQAVDERGTQNPLASAGHPAIRRALAHGTSQSGRYLRDYLYRGFNADESDRIVFEGMNPHIATARLFLNFRFAEPEHFAYPGGYGHLFYPDVNFPFAYETQSDPLTGKTDGLLKRCTARGNCPKIVQTVGSTEYWLSSQSLGTTDPLGTHDSTPPANVRIYLITGTQHTGGRGAVNAPGYCALPYNPVDARPALRALLIGLDRWVQGGAPPPPSRYPRVDDKTLVPAEQVGFPSVPGVTWPAGAQPRPLLDYGPDFDKGLISKVLPAVLPKAYPTLVPKVDADGNEIAGIRLPDIAVPRATMTGWALRAKGLPAAGELCMLDGSTIPFAKTKAERDASGDPRPSLQERYRDQADYIEQVRKASQTLEQQGYLLQEDVTRIVAQAAMATDR